MDKHSQEQWKMKQVNLPYSGTGVILLFGFLNFYDVVHITDKKWYLYKESYKGKTFD